MKKAKNPTPTILIYRLGEDEECRTVRTRGPCGVIDASGLGELTHAIAEQLAGADRMANTFFEDHYEDSALHRIAGAVRGTARRYACRALARGRARVMARVGERRNNDV